MKKIDFDKPSAIVLGLGQNGLATVRALGRMGIPVISIGRNLKLFTARSRYCRKIFCPDFGSGEGLIDLLLEIGKQLPRKGVLFPSGDFNLQLISKKRELLKDYYHFTCPSRDIVNLTLDKKKFYKFARERDFPIPQTFFPTGIDECRQVAKEINYPCIIKPFQPNLGWRQKFPDQKLFEAERQDTLLQLYERLVRVHHDLVVQECIPGNESNLSFSLTYFDSKSRPLGMFTGHKVRQYPPYFGTSSLAESRWDPRIADKTVKILQAMQYTGYGSVEFKWDPRDKQFKIIEVSARTWFPHGISAACGLNLEYIAYCDKVGLPKVPSNGFREGVKWIHEERDLRSSLYYLHEGEINFLEWLKSYRGKRVYALSSWDDPLPFIYFLGHLITVPWRRMLRHVSSQ